MALGKAIYHVTNFKDSLAMLNNLLHLVEKPIEAAITFSKEQGAGDEGFSRVVKLIPKAKKLSRKSENRQIKGHSLEIKETQHETRDFVKKIYKQINKETDEETKKLANMLEKADKKWRNENKLKKD